MCLCYGVLANIAFAHGSGSAHFIFHPVWSALCICFPISQNCYWHLLYFGMFLVVYYGTQVKFISEEKQSLCNKHNFKYKHIFMFFVDQDDYKIMLGHYFFFLKNLNTFLCFFLFALLSKLNLVIMKAGGNTNMVSSVLYFIYPMLHWLSIKFHYHFAIWLISHSFTTTVLPAIARVCSYMNPGISISLCIYNMLMFNII